VRVYTVYIRPRALREIKNLPGHVRQRVRRAVYAFADDPRPSDSRKLTPPRAECDLWRFRLDKWRIVYAISEPDKAVDVLAVRTRPPYDYADLEELLSEL